MLNQIIMFWETLTYQTVKHSSVNFIPLLTYVIDVDELSATINKTQSIHHGNSYE